MTLDLEQQHERFIRHLITDGYLRSEKVTNAFRKIRRHDFLPDYLKEQAYHDHAIAIKFRNEKSENECISSCSQPSLTAMMIEWLDVQPGVTVLDIGTGSGYTAALLCEAAGNDKSVYSMDIDEDLIKAAEQRLNIYGLKPRLTSGDALHSIPFGLYFDRLLVTAGVPYVPQCWADSLLPGAVIVMPFYWGGIDYLMTLSLNEPGLMKGQCRIFTVFTGLTKTRDSRRVLEIACGKGTVLLYDYFGADGNNDFPGIQPTAGYQTLNFETVFSSTEKLLGFHIYTLAKQPFFHGGLQLAHSGSHGSGFHGYAFYAADPVRNSFIILPFESGYSGFIGIGNTDSLTDGLTKMISEWEKTGKPGIADYRIRFVFNRPDYKIMFPGGWHIRKEKNYLHITAN